MRIVRALLAAAMVVALFGCEKGVENAPGKDAKLEKEYTKEDALSIKPKRAGND